MSGPTNEAGFVDRILAAPEDDAPRLEYADWLASRDDPRGEFIRLDITMDRASMTSPGYGDLRRRHEEYLNRHEKAWLQPLRDLGLRLKAAGGYTTAGFSRGFVEWLSVSKAGVVPQKADQLFQAFPLLRNLSFDKGTVDVEALAASPWLARLTTLSLYSDTVDAKGLRALADSPHARNLRKLSLQGNEIGPAGVATLIASPHLMGLSELSLNYCKVGHEGLSKFLVPNAFPSLKVLDLSSNDLCPASPEGLLAGKALAKLHLPKLEELSLEGNDLGPETLEGMTQWPQLTTLTRLNLDLNNLGPDGAIALCASGPLTRLRHLSLGWNGIENDGAEALAQANLPALTNLNLSRNDLDIEGLRFLLTAPYLSSLEELNLEYSVLGDEGVALLVGSSSLTSLHTLNARGGNIGVAGLQALVESPHCSRIVNLDLQENPLGSEGAQLLLGASFDKLRLISLESCEFKPADKKRLKERFGESVYV